MPSATDPLAVVYSDFTEAATVAQSERPTIRGSSASRRSCRRQLEAIYDLALS